MAERFAHFVSDSKGRDTALEDGTPVTAVCGRTWVPSRVAFKYPLCPVCATEALISGWMA